MALNKNRQELLELKHLLLQADNFLSDPAVLIPDSQYDDLKGIFCEDLLKIMNRLLGNLLFDLVFR